MKIHASKRLKAFPEDLLTDLLEKIGLKIVEEIITTEMGGVIQKI